MRKAERTLAKKSGVKKRIIPYVFRHTAASHDAELSLGEEELRKKYGWEPGSKMPAIYLHMRDTAFRSALYKAYGRKVTKELETKPEIYECPRCRSQVHPSFRNCPTCTYPLFAEDLARKSVEIEDIKLRYEKIEKQLQDQAKNTLETMFRAVGGDPQEDLKTWKENYRFYKQTEEDPSWNELLAYVAENMRLPREVEQGIKNPMTVEEATDVLRTLTPTNRKLMLYNIASGKVNGLSRNDIGAILQGVTKADRDVMMQYLKDDRKGWTA